MFGRGHRGASGSEDYVRGINEQRRQKIAFSRGRHNHRCRMKIAIGTLRTWRTTRPIRPSA